jgi:hypothetical protein|tara:strand:+ start:2583 stop:3221 length:639 start_codon:yes stop_codon:yes gene_type:complete
MCGVYEAMAALQIGQALMGHQQKKAVAEATRQSNKITEQNANISYLNDIQKIEGERTEAAREFSLEEFKRKMDLRGRQATALNLGFGNSQKIIQDLAGVGDTDYVELQNAFLSDMYKANYQYDQAYANMNQTRSKYLKNTEEPSGLATALNIGAAGLNYGMAYNKGLTSLNPSSNMASAASSSVSYGSGTGGFEGFKPAGQFEIPTRTLGGK